MEVSIETLFEAHTREEIILLPKELSTTYGGDLRFPEVPPDRPLVLLKDEFDVGSVLLEGGPPSFMRFLADHAIDELFLTLASQVPIRIAAGSRPALVMNTQFFPDKPPG